MKKYLYFLVVALFATMSFALTGCGDDNDEPTAGDDSIVGTWENVAEWATVIGKQYLKFQYDGTYYEVTVSAYDNEVEVLKGKWSKDGKTLRITGSELTNTTATISNLTNSSLSITTMGISQDYKKVSDSTIDKYLK